MKLNVLSITGTVLCIACIQFLHAQSNRNVPIDPNLRTGRLPNGFTYYIRKNKKPEKKAIFYLVNKAGSILESEDQQGLAHFLEHMAFNGTKHFPKNELINYLQNAGVRFGADLNATTGFDQTVYQIPVRSDNKELLKNTIQILRDWAQDITLDSLEIDRERGVILEEKRMRLGAAQRVAEKTTPVLFNQSRYASRIPIGTEEILKGFKHEALHRFYHDWYRPDLQALIIVGDIDILSMEAMIVSRFSDLKNPDNKPERKSYGIPLLDKNQFLLVTDPEVPEMNINIYIKHLAAEMRTEEDFRQYMLRSLFNEIVALRLNELTRQQETPFRSAGMNAGHILSNMDGFAFSVKPKPGETENAVKALWAEVEKIKRFGFLASELNTAKVNFISRYEAAFKERDNTASDNYVQEYVNHFIEGEASPGIVYEYDFFRKAIEEVSVNDLGVLFTKWYTPVNRDIIITANEKDSAAMPSEERLLGWMKEIESGTVTAYTDKPVNDKLIQTLPPAGRIISEKKLFDKFNITECRLSNGIKVLLKPTDFKKDEILFSAISPGGSSMVSDSDFMALQFSSEIVVRSGLGDLSAPELRKMLAGKRVVINPIITSYDEGFNSGCSVRDLETALQLLHLYFTSPRFDPAQLQILKQQYRISYENARKLPATIFADTIQNVSSSYNYRKMRPTPDQIDAIEPDKAFTLYKERFNNAGDVTFVFTGSFDPEQIKPLLEKYLGSLPAAGKAETPVYTNQNIAKGLHSRKVTGGKEPQAQVVLMLSGEFIPDANSRLHISVLNEILTLRLIEKLREEAGGIYNIRVSPSFRNKPTGEYTITIRFTCAPENVEPLIVGVFSAIGQMKTSGILPEEINKVKTAAAVQKQRLLKENGYWHNLITDYSAQNRTEEQVEEDVYSERLWKQLSPESVQATAIKYLRLDNYMRFVLLPEK